MLFQGMRAPPCFFWLKFPFYLKKSMATTKFQDMNLTFWVCLYLYVLQDSPACLAYGAKSKV